MGLVRFLLLFLVIYLAIRLFQSSLRKKRTLQPRPDAPPPHVALKPCQRCGAWSPVEDGETKHLCPPCRESGDKT